MSHSISVLSMRDRARAGEILPALAKRLDIAAIRPDHAGLVQLWLPLDGSTAHEKIVAALDLTADDWREYIGFR
jgi:hypothetical protein